MNDADLTAGLLKLSVILGKILSELQAQSLMLRETLARDEVRDLERKEALANADAQLDKVRQWMDSITRSMPTFCQRCGIPSVHGLCENCKAAGN